MKKKTGDICFWRKWSSAKNRCLNTKNIAYPSYGGRGIKFSKQWSNFLVFQKEMYESYKKHVVIFGIKNTMLDCIDNDKGYSKKNCRWATRTQQNNNRRNNVLVAFKGKTQTLSKWREKFSLPETVYLRIRNGEKPETAFTRPFLKSIERRGEKNPVARLKNNQIFSIRSQYKKGITQIALAKKYGVTQGCISRIVLNKTYA